MVERDYDLVWVHFLNMMQYFRDSVIEKTLQNVPVVLDQHNDDERVWRRMQDRGSLIERLYARWNIPRIREFRSWAVSRCDLVLSVSNEEAQKARDRLMGDIPVWVAPNGVDLGRFANTGSVASSNRVIFVGSMDVSMNVDAVEWFCDDIFPYIRDMCPESEFFIVGRNPSSKVRALDRRDGVVVTGHVDDVAPYYHEASVAVAPLRFGGGTKLKVLEAMAARVPVVTTSVGGQGIALQDGEHAYIEDEEVAFANRVADLLQNRRRAVTLSKAAYELVAQQYDWSEVYDSVIDRLDDTGLVSDGSR